MPDNNTFVLTAIVDVAQANAAMDQFVQGQTDAINKVTADWEAASTPLSRTIKKISDATRAGAAVVTDEWKRIAEADQAVFKARTEVAATNRFQNAVSGKGDIEAETVATNLNAEAKRKLAVAEAEAKAARDAAAPSIAQLGTAEIAQAVNSEVAAAATTKIAGAMGMARVEAGALTGSTGMMVGGMARLAGSSEMLAPILAAAFPIFGAIALIDMVKSLYSEFGKVADQIVGYTEAVKNSEKEAVKASTLALGQAGSLEQAQSKIHDSIREIGDIANESFAERWRKAAKIAYDETSTLYNPLSGLTILYRSLDAAESGAADQAVRLATAQSSLFKASLEQQASQSREAAKLIDAKTAAEDAGVTRVQAIRNEIAALADKQAAEEKIAAAEAAAKNLNSPEAAREATKTAKADIDEEYYLKRIELTNRLALAEEDEKDRAISAHDELAQSAGRVVDSYNKVFETEIDLQNQENEMFARSSEKDVEKSIETAQKKVDSGIKYAEEYDQIVEQSALAQVAAGEAAAADYARIERAKLASVVTTDLARLQISTQIDAQELSAKEALENKKTEIEINALEARKARLLGGQTEPEFKARNIDNDDERAKLDQMNAAIAAAKQAHGSRMQQLNAQETLAAQEAADKQLQIYMRSFQGINQGFERMTQQVLENTKTVGRAFEEMGANILMSVIQSFEQMILKQAETFLIQNVLEKSATLQSIITFLSGAAAKHAAVDTAAIADTTTAAGVGAAFAFASVMESLPFPVNVATAPGVAAATFAQIEAVGLPKALKGALIPHDMPIFAHGGEMVLPPSLSKGFQHIIGNMSLAGAPGGAGGPGGPGGAGGSSSGITHNYHGDIHVSAFDAKSVEQMIERHKGAFKRAAAGIVRNGWRGR